MNKMFSANQRKDKDLSTGQYNHPMQEGTTASDSKNSKWPLIAVCAVVAVIVILAVILL